MKYLFNCLALLFILSCNNQKKQQSATQENIENRIENFDWLLGNWKRLDDKNDKQTYEYWVKASDDLYIGMGCTLANQDTVWREDVLLKKHIDYWNFEVTGKGDSTATLFKLSQITNTGFTCKNPLNEFPKKIEYKRDGEKLKAVISEGGPTIPFTFEALKEQ